MLILKTVAKIHILSFMKDIIGAKLSSIEDKMCKKGFYWEDFPQPKYSIRKSSRQRNFALFVKHVFIVENHDR